MTSKEICRMVKRIFSRRNVEEFYTQHRQEFQNFSLFIGYPRSAHSLIGQLLSAHPDILMTHEFNVLEKFVQYSDRDQFLKKMCETYLLDTPIYGKQYNYAVPSQFQGRIQQLRIIGDKRGGNTTSILHENFSLLERFQKWIGFPLKIFHVVRNPFDNISSYSTLLKQNIADSINVFASIFYPTTSKVIQQYPDLVLTVHAEDLFSKPQETLAKMLRFLDLPADEKYFKDCSSIIWDKPHISRFNPNINWASEDIKRVDDELIAKYSFLQDYRFYE